MSERSHGHPSSAVDRRVGCPLGPGSPPFVVVEIGNGKAYRMPLHATVLRRLIAKADQMSRT